MKPTTEEIVKELRWYADFYEGSTLSLNMHSAADRLEELEAKHPRWISTAEQKPRNHEHVLTYGYGGFCIACCVRGFDGSSFVSIETEHVLHGVTHWMPLPNMPEEGRA